jgi:hypothetical protein
MDRAHAERASVIVFPELGLQRFFPQHERVDNAPNLAEPVPGPTTEAIAERARRLSMVTILNLYEIDDHGRCYDTSPVLDAVEDLVIVDMDLSQCASCTARRLFWQDRRPELYAKWLGV